MNKIGINEKSTSTSNSAAFTETDTLYELSCNLDLAGATVKIPERCILKFEEGAKISNGTLALNNTLFEGTRHCILTEVSGIQKELDTDYFDLTKENKTAIMQSIVDTASVIQLHGRLENVFYNIQLGNKDLSLIGNGATVVNTFTESAPAIVITSNNFVRIVDLDFEISSGYAIYKNVPPELETKLSFIIDRCRFVGVGITDVTTFIELLGSREGNISNCFFEGPTESHCIGMLGSREGNISNCFFEEPTEIYCIGINRTSAVNTNVIGCMFSNLKYGIKAVGVKTSRDVSSEQYSVFACGLNVQSAVMVGCEYGIYIEGNDSFFLNNSMIDHCVNPLVMMSQDGANVTNNYFSTSCKTPSDYTATITVRNNSSKGAVNRNQRIIISGNTIYGHRTTNNHGIDFDVESKDCTIQGNTLDFFTDHGIYLRHDNTGTEWTTQKLVIDNNRFYFAYGSCDGIGGYNYTGDFAVIITNNYAIEGDNTQLLNAGTPYLGNYVCSGNHDYLPDIPSGSEGPQVYYASRRKSTRMKIGLVMEANSNTLTISNPMNEDTRIVVYVGNNRYPICVESITSTHIVFSKGVSEAVSFFAIIEHVLNP